MNKALLSSRAVATCLSSRQATPQVNGVAIGSPGNAGAQGPKTVKGSQSDPNYVSRLLLDCVPVFHKIITPAYLLYCHGPVAIYFPKFLPSLFYGSFA